MQKGKSGPYLLFWGNRVPHKNFELNLRAHLTVVTTIPYLMKSDGSQTHCTWAPWNLSIDHHRVAYQYPNCSGYSSPERVSPKLNHTLIFFLLLHTLYLYMKTLLLPLPHPLPSMTIFPTISPFVIDGNTLPLSFPSPFHINGKEWKVACSPWDHAPFSITLELVLLVPSYSTTGCSFNWGNAAYFNNLCKWCWFQLWASTDS